MFEWQLASPWFLLVGLLALPVLWACFQTRSTLTYSSLELVQDLQPTLRTRLAMVPSLCFALGIILLAVALARPQTADDTARVSREGIAIMLVLDRSGSMDARDLEEDFMNVNRLEVVKDVLHYFITGSENNDRFEALTDRRERKFTDRGRPDDMIGLVTFAGFADSVCPLTLDHGNLLEMINQIKLADRTEGGTAIGEGLGLAVERLRQTKIRSKIVILLTDGVNNTGELDPLQAGDLAAKEDIKVYSIGAGTNGYAPFPVPNPLTGRTELRAIKVEIDEESLQAISEKTSGRYFRATDKQTLKEIYDEIDQLEKTEVSELKYLDFQEHFETFLKWAIGLIILGSLLRLTWLRRFP